MVNTALFQTTRGNLVPEANTLNEAGGAAYKLSPEHALAQYAVTGCLSNTFYASAETQLDKVVHLCRQVSPEFIAKLAVYARHKGFMKDLPALLVSYLTVAKVNINGVPPLQVAEKVGDVLIFPQIPMEFFKSVFPKVINNGKMLRNFCQIIRSGVLGRKSFGTRPKKEIQNWLNNMPIDKLIEAYVGDKPSLADIIKMVHPKAKDAERDAFFAWVIGKEYGEEFLPVEIKKFEAWKKNRQLNTLHTDDGKIQLDVALNPVPKVPFQMLTSLPLGKDSWGEIALNANWHTLRMNLNTFSRHGVFEDKRIVEHVANKLKDADIIRKAKVFPYQLYTTYKHAQSAPDSIKEAIQDALDTSVENIPEFNGRIAIMIDTSGSMDTPVTGSRGSATSVAKCNEVAGLIAASLLRKNKDSIIIGFHDQAFQVKLNPRDSIVTNTYKLCQLPTGGTNCSVAMAALCTLREKVDLIIMISDNQSWVETKMSGGILHVGQGTHTMQKFSYYCSAFNPKCKLVNIDLQPYNSTQTCEASNVMNIGGFSDNIFEIINLFMKGDLSSKHWVDEINKVVL